MKDEIKLISELKANEGLSYIGDKIWLEIFAYLAEICERFKAKRKVTNIIQLRDESARIVFEVAKLTFVT